MKKFKLLEYYHMFSTKEFEEAYHYKGDDLGAVWTKEDTRFRVWAPSAEQVMLKLYLTGHEEEEGKTLPMTKAEQGTWTLVVPGDLNGIYYTYIITVEGETKEAVDPYARAVGVNGMRGMVIDLASTNPEGFATEVKPDFVNATDAVIYELHIRDFSIDNSSGMKNKGKYLAFTETGTTNSYGESTGIDYLKELGVTHVQLLPTFDYKTVDETRLEEPQFNWGYDPQNFNVPEGSYSVDPYHGEVRVKEFKQLVQSLHQIGIRVIMDVVYNHTMESEESNFNRIVPGYYYRLTEEGNFSNASGCGNETASERVMMRKFMIDSLLYWAKEYHIDGFRFDLMGIHDITTMKEIRAAFDNFEPNILLYGEGWSGGLSPLPESERMLKSNIRRSNTNIAAFHDNLRDAVKGSVFEGAEGGFVQGVNGREDTIKFGVVAATQHEWIDYSKVLYGNEPWATNPTQCVNYVSAHDNFTLWDKITLSTTNETIENKIRMNLLCAAIILTSQGIPFFQAGEEFLRSKPMNMEGNLFCENSYRSSDAVNSLKWDLRTLNKEVVEYYKGLIAFRKLHPGLRMATLEELEERLTFFKWMEPNVVAYLIKETKTRELCVIYNANRTSKNLLIPSGIWNVYVKGNKAGTIILEEINQEQITIAPISAMVLVRN